MWKVGPECDVSQQIEGKFLIKNVLKLMWREVRMIALRGGSDNARFPAIISCEEVK